MRWLADGEPHLPVGRDWLSAGEAQRLAGFRFTKPHNEFLVRRWTAKRAIASALSTGTEPESLRRIEVRNRASGAPFVVVDGEPAPIDISLSDRAGWAVCLVSPPGSFQAGTLGIDLEIVEPRSAGFLADFLTPSEQDVVARSGDHNHASALANLFWSAKEAALKVLQLGLRVDTQHVHVTLDQAVDFEGWGGLSVDALGQSFPGYWRRSGAFVLTLCFAPGHLPDAPPEVLGGGADLATAVPVHTWITSPLVQQPG